MNHEQVGFVLVSLVAKEQTHFISTLVAKIFMAKRKMGLDSSYAGHYISFVSIN